MVISNCYFHIASPLQILCLYDIFYGKTRAVFHTSPRSPNPLCPLSPMVKKQDDFLQIPFQDNLDFFLRMDRLCQEGK